MRRWLGRIMVCLLLGSATTVAVAWGCVWMLDTSLEARERLASERRTEILMIYTPLHSKRIQERFGWLSRGFGARYEIAGTLPWGGFYRSPFEDHFLQIVIVEAGWPWLAVRGECVQNFDFDADDSMILRFSKRSGVIDIPVKDGYGSDPIIVPFRPIWPGFIGSVILYGSAWLMVLTMPGVLRRRLRRRRGRCVRCNYDLRGDLERGCSECGWNRET